jgi:hypothetical protein
MASKLLSKPLTKEELKIKNQSLEHDRQKLIKSNKAHVAAILATKKLFSKMTLSQQYETIEWAHDIKVMFRREE